MSKDVRAGGQAVIEGVMMRTGDRMAVAVRTPDGAICVQREWAPSIADKYPVLRWPIIRGAVSLVESLSLGIRALMFSANAQAEDEEEELTPREMAGAVLFSVLLAVVLFVVLPTLLTALLRNVLADGILLNLIEGLIRLLVVVTYVAAIGFMPDMGRVLQYHGAEHMVIHSWEASGRRRVAPVVQPDELEKHGVIHPRCGTNFILMVALVSIVLFSFFGWPSLWVRLGLRLLLLPVVAGIAYEFILLGSRSNLIFFRLLMLPGMWLQRLTTREPDEQQLEVAIAALEGCLLEEVELTHE